MSKQEVLTFLKTCNYAEITTLTGLKTVINCKYILLTVKREPKHLTDHPKKLHLRNITPATLNEWINAKQGEFYLKAHELFPPKLNWKLVFERISIEDKLPF